MPKICVIGSANLDFTVTADRLPAPGETVSGGELVISHGGKGANQAVAARKLGAEVRLIACLGQDQQGDGFARHLAEAGLPLDRIIRVPKAATGVALIVVDQRGENQIVVAPGANRLLTVDRIREREADIAWADVLLIQLEPPIETVRWALECARRHGVTTLVNPAPFCPLSRSMLDMIDVITPNQREAEALTGLPAGEVSFARGASEKLLALGVGNVIITLGAKGAYWLDRLRTGRHFRGFPARVVDTTAAGDAFNGGLAYGLASGRSVEESIPLASAMGALACTKAGAQESLPDRAQVDEFLSRIGAGRV